MKVMLDREREVKFDLNAMAKFAEITGHEIWEADWRNIKSADLRLMLWCALLRDDPSITLEGAGALIDSENMEQITQSLIATAAASMPKKDDGSPNPAAAESGTG